MKLKPLILIFVFLISLSIVNAIPKRDGMNASVGFNANTSRNSSDWKFYVDFAKQTELNFSLFQLHNNVPYSVGNGYLNISSTDTAGAGFTNAIFTGKNASIFGIGDCVSINWSSKRYTTDSSAAPIGFHDSLPVNGSTTRIDTFGEDIIIIDGAGVGAEPFIRARANDGITEIEIQKDTPLGQVYNSTICIMQGAPNNIFAWYFNGTDINNQTVVFGTATSYNLTMQVDINQHEIQVYWIGVFNGTLGAPTRDPNPLIADTTAPIVNTSFNSSSPDNLMSVFNFTANITDETGLSTANWTINLSTGTLKINNTVSGTSAQVSNTTSFIGIAGGSVINFTLIVTDTSNNVKQNSTVFTLVDVIFPIVNTSFNITSPRINDIINFTGNLTDESGLSTANITYNMSETANGAGVLTKINFTLSGTTAQISNKTQITCGRGCVINFTMYVTDTGNNVKQNSTLITVADTVQNNAAILNPVLNNLYTTSKIDLNITWLLDLDADAVTNVYWWINDTSKPNQSISISGGNTGNTTFNASDGKYNLSVSICNAFSCSANVTISSFKIDTINPTTNLTSALPNLTFLRLNTNFTIGAEDSNLEVHNVTCVSGDEITGTMRFSSETNLTGTINTFLLEINTSWGDGRYTCTSNVSDDHTAKIKKNYSITKDLATLKLDFLTTESKDDTISIKLKSSDIGLLDFYAYKSEDEAKYIYVFNFSNTSVNSNINHTYVIKYASTNHKLSYRSGSKFKSHFTTPNNWLDCNLRTNYSSLTSYDITEAPANSGQFETTITTPETTIICDSLGGKNRIGQRTQVEIDTEIPTFNSFNLSTAKLFGNNTIINARLLNFTFNVSDKNNHSVLAYLNGEKSESTGYISNISKNLTITITSDGDYLVVLSINDSAGNWLNGTVYNVSVDTTDQNVRNITPINNTVAGNAIINFTANITEIHPDKMELWINSTGIWHLNRTASYQNNVTSNFSLFNLSDGIYLWTICANDTTGGKSCFAGNYTLTVDSTLPIITLESPANNTVITAGEPPNVNFRISGNEDVKNCSLFLSGTLVGNESTQKKSHNFTVNSIAGGVYTWNASCYDLADNFGASSTIRLEIGIISGGSSVTPSPSGSGIGVPSLIDETGQKLEIIDKGYTMTYICRKIKSFLSKNPNYDLSSIVLLQEDIRFEINFIIPFTTLKGYVDNYEQFCENKRQENTAENKTQPSIQPTNDRFLKFANFDLMSHIKFPFQIDFGKLGSYGKGAVGLFDFMNIFMPLSVSDEISEKPNVVWEGGIRIFPAIGVIILVVIIIASIKFSYSKKKLDLFSSVESAKKEKNK